MAGLARAVGRPVVWTESRAENLTSSVHGRAQRQRLRWAAPAPDGSPHYELEVVQDAGAYPSDRRLPAHLHPQGVHRLLRDRQRLDQRAEPCHQHRAGHRPTGAPGGPRPSTPSSGPVDLYAAAIGMDPAEVRRLNFVAPESFPYTNPAGSTYDTGDFGEALDRALAAARYGDLRAEQAARRAGGRPDAARQSASLRSWRAPRWGPSELGVRSSSPADGSLGGALGRRHRVRAGSRHLLGHDRGRGHRCSAPTASRSISGDTAEIASSGLTAASRSAQLAGSAVLDRGPTPGGTRPCPGRGPAGGRRGRYRARHRRGGPSTVVGSPHSPGSLGPTSQPSRPRPATLRWPQPRTSSNPDNTYAFGCHLAVVEVDSRTGETTLRRLVACGRRRHAHQPPHRRGPGPGGHRPGRGPSAAGGDGLRRRRQPDGHQPRRLPGDLGPLTCRASTWSPMETPTPR